MNIIKHTCLNFIIILICSSAFANTVLDTKNQELKNVTQEIQGLTSLLNKAQNQKQNLGQQLKTIEISIGHIANKITRTQNKLDKEKTLLTALNQQHDLYQQQLEQQQALLAQQFRAAYMLGQHHTIKLLLSQQQPQSISRLLEDYRFINASRIKIINDLDTTLVNLARNQAQIQTQSQKYAALFEQEQQQSLSLKQRYTERQQVLAALTHQISTKSAKLTQLKINQAELQNLIDKLEREPQIITRPKVPFIEMKGKLHWPTEGPITKNFGYTIDTSGTAYNGVFISASIGQPIYATYPGKVVFADWLRGVGLLVIIQHDQDFMTLYGHAHSILVKTGDMVTQGQEIATIGQSGGYENSGLFFQIRRDGKPLDPKGWCI